MSSSTAVETRETQQPPSPPAEEVSRRKRGPLWARLLVGFGVLLMIASGSALVAMKSLLDRATAGVGQLEISNDPGNTSIVAQGQALKGTLNILMLGVDDGQAIGGELREDVPLADSIMILHVPESHDHAYLVSLPRDLWVDIPGHGSAKLNSAYTLGHGNPKAGGRGRAGGLELLMKTISAELGIVFNSAAIVNFTGFTEAVKQLGGVTMYIDEQVKSVHYGTTKDGQHCGPAWFDDNAVARPNPGCTPRVYERGTERLNAEQALDYTRQREWMELNDGDYGRQRHQQQFIKALMREAKAQGLTTNLPKALALVEAVGSALTVWTHGAKLEDWFFTLKDLAAGEITMVKTNMGQYNRAAVTSTWAEALTPESEQMFEALRDKRIHEFLLEHPGYLGGEA